MAEILTTFIKENASGIIGAGIGIGSFFGLVAILGGYAISRAMSLVSDK